MGQVQSVTTGNAEAAKLAEAGKPPASPKPHNPRLWKAATDFQEVMLSQFTQSMRASENDSDLFEECPGRETFDQMFSDAIAHEMSKSGALGLNKLIYRAMGGTYEKSAAAPEPAKTKPDSASIQTEKAE
jgi:Rod binding domain-containing protein